MLGFPQMENVDNLWKTFLPLFPVDNSRPKNDCNKVFHGDFSLTFKTFRVYPRLVEKFCTPLWITGNSRFRLTLNTRFPVACASSLAGENGCQEAPRPL